MVKYIYANNYKSFVNFRVEFNQINLLMGKNGAGKSNIFVLITSIRNLIEGKSGALGIGFPHSTLTRWMKSNIQTVELCITSDAHEYTYFVEIEHNIGNNTIVISSEKVTCSNKTLYQMSDGTGILYDDNYVGRQAMVDPTISGMNYIIQDGKHTLLQEFREQIDKILLCTPNPKAMVDMVQNDIYGPMDDFSNIASAYAGFMQLAPELYTDLIAVLRDIEPSLERVRIAVEPYSKYLAFEYNYKDVNCLYRFSELSDGERMIFALYLLLYGYAKKGMTVLLDEPDNYISLREIQPWCMDIERIIGESGQCLMISHHPEVIDYMADTSGIWLSRVGAGESRVVESIDIQNNNDLLTYSQMISRGMLDEIK